MHELEHRMADAGDELEKVLERYSDLQHEYEREGGFEYSAKAEAILQGLGFDRDLWQMETEKLSGGQQNRLGLACLLLSEPDVLLLRRTDESSRCGRRRVAGRVSANLRFCFRNCQPMIVISSTGRLAADHRGGSRTGETLTPATTPTI